MLLIREFPNVDAKYSFMRFHAGRIEQRPMVIPIYGDRNQYLGLATAGAVSVFRLLGFGETQQKAIEMAEGKDL